VLNERGPRDRLWHFATGQRGYFTAADAVAAGYSYQAVLHRAVLADADVEQHEGFRVTTPVRAVVETAAAGMDQDVIYAAVSDLVSRGGASERLLLHAAQRLGPRAELTIERALREKAD